MKFALLALTIAVASADKCSHTTCKMVDVDSLFPGHLGSGYKVMQITHSNEETVCHKHSNAHDNHGDAAFAWQETGNKLPVNAWVSNKPGAGPSQKKNAKLVRPAKGEQATQKGEASASRAPLLMAAKKALATGDEADIALATQALIDDALSRA